jgi:amino acid adenylation domain-containing protein
MTIAPRTPFGMVEATEFPTSFAQRRLWFMDRLRPGDSAYNVPVAARVHGDLDVPALRRALDRLVARHEILRTTFHERDGEPVQVVAATASVPLPVHEVHGDAALDAAVRAAAAAPFDLSTGPLLRCALLRGDTGPVILMTAHHIVIDGWSLGVFFRELGALYAAELTGEAAQVPELTVQYGDFAAWQQTHCTPEALDADVRFWRETLADAPKALDLPTEFPRGRQSSGAGALTTARLSRQLAEDVDELAELSGATPYMTLLAAFQALLGRLAGATDVVVGSPVAGRMRPELEPLIGCFINTLPQRADLNGSPSFRDLLDRVRTATLAAYQHQTLSFEHIVDAVRPDRAAAETPLFQVMFGVNNTPQPTARDGRLGLEFLPQYRDRVKYDLSVTVSRSPDGMDVTVEYRTDLFGPEWIERFLSHYRTLLTAAVLDPDRPIGDLPLLGAAERHRVLEQFNDTTVPFPDDVCVHELVKEQAARTPDATAVVLGEQRLSYRTLYARADRLAHRLRQSGIGPGRRVALCMERSPELVTAILGVLIAGGAYVPLDPDYPDERLDFQLADAQADVVLTHGPVRDRVPATAVTVLEVDRLDLETGPGVGPEQAAAPTDPAYVIYTSGSTGRPKGVANTHRGLVNRLVWMQRQFGLDATDAVLQKTPYGFDVSVWEFLWPLLSGARLVLAEPGAHKDPARLARVIRAEAITTMHFVPSMLSVFVEAADITSLDSLRRVICSGEELSAELVRLFHAGGTRCELHNLYGPTEAAIDVSHWHCPPDGTGRTVPIGRPIANTRLYVLDPTGEPTPIGVPGELHIGGVQVAAGYVNRPELTAERFVTDPFAPHGVMYRTGDLARWSSDGTLQFLGRLDHQVKLRGFRIELGEVEAALRDTDGVGDAVAVPHGDRLLAYVTGEPDAVDPAALREQLGRRLPEYMVPSVVVRLDSIPLTANGKVDRKALPAPKSAAPRATGAAGARDHLELELIALWEELLETGPIGVSDDFFDLGGNSLRVIRMLGRVLERYGQDIPVSAMFSGAATVERLARELRSAGDGAGARVWSPLVALRASGGRTPLFCLPPAVGNVLSYVDLARHLPRDQPVYGLQASGLESGQQPFRSLEEAAECYVRAIRQVQPHGPYRLAGYCVGSVGALAVARRLLADGEPTELLLVLDGGPPRLDNGFESADQADVAAWFAWELGRAAGRRLEIDPAELSGLTGTALTDAVLARAKERDVLPSDTAPAHIGRLLTTFDAGVRAVRDYPAEAFPGAVTALRAADEEPESSPVRRWEALATGGLRLREVPGDHYSMMRPPHVRELALAVDELLSRGAADDATPTHGETEEP